MEKQIIISVGREFGSGGHEIAKKLSEHYKIQLFDQNILEEVAREKGVDIKNLKGLDEKSKNLFMSRTVRGFSSSPEENLYLLQFDYLQKMAKNGESFVIVGRCSESILKDYEGLISIFVLGDKEKKVQRIMKLYQKSESMAEKLICEMDAKRKRYHNSYSKEKWGDSKNYDISINSSRLGIEGTAEMLIEYIDKRKSSAIQK